MIQFKGNMLEQRQKIELNLNLTTDSKSECKSENASNTPNPKAKRNRNCVPNLPSELIQEIFLKLPPNSIVNVKNVKLPKITKNYQKIKYFREIFREIKYLEK